MLCCSTSKSNLVWPKSKDLDAKFDEQGLRCHNECILGGFDHGQKDSRPQGHCQDWRLASTPTPKFHICLQWWMVIWFLRLLLSQPRTKRAKGFLEGMDRKGMSKIWTKSITRCNNFGGGFYLVCLPVQMHRSLECHNQACSRFFCFSSPKGGRFILRGKTPKGSM